MGPLRPLRLRLYLLDGYATGLGMWEASHNETHMAIDLIPKDVVICDWHYERADKTAV